MIYRKLIKARIIFKNEGLIGLLIRSLQKIQKIKHTKIYPIHKRQIGSLVKYDDILNNSWPVPVATGEPTKKTPPYTISWIMSPPGKGSGGHQNIFRFISYLERAGHTCNVYLYSSSNEKPTLKEIKSVLSDSYPKVNASIEWYEGRIKDSDALFATGWETAYPVYAQESSARKFYFVQDFEPYFYPVGTDYMLSENTYKFNFYGITAGKWLQTKLSENYGMNCQSYDFGADGERYRLQNNQKRKEVFFYARPVTARRGFELGIMALDPFHKRNPEYKITLAGWDVSDYDIPFPYENLKTLSLDELPDVYNRSAAALVISLTNMSLLPLELLSCGTIPVVTDGDNNRLVSSNPFISYAQPSPNALATALTEVVTRQDLEEYSKKAAESVTAQNWDKAGERFNQIVLEVLNG